MTLIQRAADQLGAPKPAVADAWLSSLEAVAQATARKEAASWAALDRSTAAVDRIGADDPPPWPWVFPFDQRKIAAHRLRCAVLLGRPAAVDAVSGDLEAALSTGHVKQRALLLLDLASAHIQTREAEEAFRLAGGAVELAAQSRSDRVLERARRFRRGFTAASAPRFVEEFDTRLRTAEDRW